ncbi:unnamed protein product [Rotaria sordida]|uniref:Uncharacterized protein n=1 Tax=Rotaria sordida TaxID=392033 RepID=A0A815K6K0_9BILA|nr:unnamed protein product [Rotaria sordida]
MINVEQNLFDKVWPNLHVLACASSQDKYVLVRGIMASKINPTCETVAITGCHNNDVPALKAADVGFSMGIQDIDAVKQALDIILLDDNFNSIFKAVIWGRNIYDPIAKIFQFKLIVNFVTLLCVFIGACIVKESPLRIVINLIPITCHVPILGTNDVNESVFPVDLDSKEQSRLEASLTQDKTLVSSNKMSSNADFGNGFSFNSNTRTQAILTGWQCLKPSESKFAFETIYDFLRKNSQAEWQAVEGKNYILFYASAGISIEDDIFITINAEAEVVLFKIISDSGSTITTVDFEILKAQIGVKIGSYNGFELYVTLVEGKVFVLDIKIGAGISSGVGINQDSYETKVFGTGYFVGRRIGISVFDSEFGVDFKRFFSDEQWNAVKPLVYTALQATFPQLYVFGQLRAGVSSGVGINQDSYVTKVFGTGYFVGRRIGISVFDSESGVDFKRFFSDEQWNAVKPIV